jgi:stage IV sporulation protein FB
MSWARENSGENRQNPNHGKPGGDWHGMRPTFDAPWTWSIPVARIAGITIRVHVIFFLYAIIMLLQSLPAGGATKLTFWPTALSIGVLFVVVLAHELGHCLACRLTGGQVDEVLMWPLGGLALCQSAPRWSAHLATALGGPCVNVLLCAVCGSMLGILLQNHTQDWLAIAISNPLHPMATIGKLSNGDWSLLTLATINEVSMIMLVLNLLPIFPLDGGRIVQSALWPRLGYSRSMLVSLRIGYIAAILLGIYGAVVREWAAVAIALFGGVICFNTQRQLQWSDSEVELEDDEYALSPHGPAEPEAIPGAATRRERQAQRLAMREQQEAQEVDRILQKIGESGMPSLTRAEKELLHRVTERKRHER